MKPHQYIISKATLFCYFDVEYVLDLLRKNDNRGMETPEFISPVSGKIIRIGYANRMFVEKGTTCSECGRKTSMVIEKQASRGDGSRKRSKIFSEFNFCCRIDKDYFMRMTCDHIIPRSAGGATVMDNLQPMCFECNDRKRTQIFHFPEARYRIANVRLLFKEKVGDKNPYYISYFDEYLKDFKKCINFNPGYLNEEEMKDYLKKIKIKYNIDISFDDLNPQYFPKKE